MIPSAAGRNLEPPPGLSPFEQLIVNAAIALARSRRRVTPEAIADTIGLPAPWVRLMWRVRSLEGDQGGVR